MKGNKKVVIFVQVKEACHKEQNRKQDDNLQLAFKKKLIFPL